MKNIERIFAISLLVIAPLEVMAQTNLNLVNGQSQESSLILQSQEIPGLHVRMTRPRDWVTKFGQKGKPPGQPGVYQEFEMQNVKGIVHLAEFTAEDEARLAAAHYVTNMAAIFSPGIWAGATNKFRFFRGV